MAPHEAAWHDFKRRIEKNLERIYGRLIEAAEAGNMQAIKMILDRLVPVQLDASNYLAIAKHF